MNTRLKAPAASERIATSQESKANCSNERRGEPRIALANQMLARYAARRL